MRRGLVWSLMFFIVVAVGALGATIGLGHTPLLGLDLRGGVSVVLQPQGTVNNGTLQEAVSIIDRRVNGLGVSNSDVARQGKDVVINLPGIRNSQQALAELGKTAVLYFRPVLCEIAPYSPASQATPSTTAPAATPGTTAPASTPATTAKSLGAATPQIRLTSAPLPAAGSTATTTPAPPTTAAPAGQSTTTTVPASSAASSACSASNSAQIPSTPAGQDTAKSTVILPDRSGQVRYVLGPADMSGSAVSNAAVQVDPNTGQYSVLLTFTSKGATEFDNIAATRYACYQQNPANPPPCSLEAFELDGLVESAPTIQAQSFHGSAVISGSSASPFTQSQASALANELKYGSLPVRFVPQSVQTVSATIGKDSLRAGLLAGIGGIAVVMIYMLLYYRALGLIVLVGLGLGGALLYSILTELSYSSGLTLTLAGVTGIIVAVGITVDSYVVYFERLKDEVRAGRSVRQSVERSFTRAFRTVLTADLVSFMAALILYILTVGDVRGFAFTLGLSTLLDVFTAYFFIRPATILVGRRRAFTDNPIFGIARGLGARTRTGEV
ncbi:MAG TPA: protein translocase subunit SecD [Acidimicrobiales bacterium]|nr:protein translocase subunit SecD [Acidimicrobiales bacterium]